MTLHTASETLVTFELSPSEKLSAEAMRQLVCSALERRGLAPWHSVELDIFEGRRGALVFAAPVKIFLPEALLRLSEGLDRRGII